MRADRGETGRNQSPRQEARLDGRTSSPTKKLAPPRNLVPFPGPSGEEQVYGGRQARNGHEFRLQICRLTVV